MASSRSYKFPWREGNRFETLLDSTEFFPRMLDAIGSARQYLLLEMYLVASGAVADRFIDALLNAADRDVQIYLLLDDFGSLELDQRDRGKLAHRNIAIVYYNPLPSYSILYNLYRIFWQKINRSLYRNHRKLLLVDGEIAFTGGAGLTDEVDSPNEPEVRWRETMIEIQGPVLGDWQQLFTESWNRYADQALTLPAVIPAPFANGQPGQVTVNEARRRMGIQRSLLKHLKSARHRIWFATAYFIPSRSIRRKLKRAARNGVDVRLLLPGPVTDHPGARYASRRYYARLLKNGVRIYEYMPRFFHAKTVLCDNWVTIGSCNYDRWNLQWNLEANQEIDDADMAATVTRMFMDDFVHSREYTSGEWERRSWHLHVLEWFWRRVELLSLKIRHRRQRDR
ncbi:MAG: phosphatidylserine/phosphatidylglycerophosphate/cardiolipin synthase family protein [Gammaproteobacteria bacterium]|nr:MAG: phosphatidylserine/phosphatidylglycerophosphate/cardiolipin synthase family protein [Gammaproteobacteria bacterium]